MNLPAADVCLVSMPYAALSRPSMALGLLKALLEDHGISTTTAYPNFWFAEHVGLPRYQLCAGRVPTDLLIGEWTFRAAAFGPDEDQDNEFLDFVLGSGGRWLPSGEQELALFREDLLAVRDGASSFVDDAARRVLATGARIVGCTSTFEQQVASLALLRRVRELDPEVITMLGGANCETTMGQTTHQNFDWVDFVVSGEADGLVGPLMQRVLEQGRDLPLSEIPRGARGPAHRRALPVAGAAGGPLARALFRDLDALPCPDFDDYFRAFDASPLHPHIRPGLPLETSRGCWWGAKHQCTFCGLNGSSMTYNSKSAKKVLSELHELEDRHGIRTFEVVDNILDTHYFTTLLPELSEDGGRERSIFFEVKANLTRAQIEQLVAAGVTWVQPGIESLDSSVLALMDKGVQGWQNIQLLKWTRELGLRLSWSILWGFPGESDDAYVRMAERIPLIEHLQPAANVVRLRYDRYSVYHNEAVERGLELSPIPAMRYVYPVPEEQLGDLTYFFTASGSGTTVAPTASHAGSPSDFKDRPGVQSVRAKLLEWHKSFAKGSATLRMSDFGDHLQITDTRACASAEQLRLDGLDRAVLLACDSGVKRNRLTASVRAHFDGDSSDARIADSIDRLVRHGLLMDIDDRLLGLVLAENTAELTKLNRFPGGSVSIAGLEPRPVAKSV